LYYTSIIMYIVSSPLPGSAYIATTSHYIVTKQRTFTSPMAAPPLLTIIIAARFWLVVVYVLV